MSLILNGNGSIQSLVAGGLPSGTVTQATLATPVAGTGPSFSVYLSGNQNLTSTVITKVAFDTEEFDTNSNFDTTNYRFTPTVAGYYQVNAAIYVISGAGASLFITSLYKNGSAIRTMDCRTSTIALTNTLPCIVYMNGSTDYLELYQRVDGSAPFVVGTGVGATFSASLVRSA